MVQGTMKWTSTTKEFGFLRPEDGGRDVFVCFSSAIASRYISDDHGDGSPVRDVIAPTQPRIPRQCASWYGACHIDGESVPSWRDCRLINFSVLGLGITLHHFWPSELVGRRISVDVPAVGNSVNIRLEGVITNEEPTSGGVVRVGIEFDGLSKVELTIASVLGTIIDGGDSESVPSPAVVEPTTTLNKIKSKIRGATQPG